MDITDPTVATWLTGKLTPPPPTVPVGPAEAGRTSVVRRLCALRCAAADDGRSTMAGGVARADAQAVDIVGVRAFCHKTQVNLFWLANFIIV